MFFFFVRSLSLSGQNRYIIIRSPLPPGLRILPATPVLRAQSRCRGSSVILLCMRSLLFYFSSGAQQCTLLCCTYARSCRGVCDNVFACIVHRAPRAASFGPSADSDARCDSSSRAVFLIFHFIRLDDSIQYYVHRRVKSYNAGSRFDLKFLVKRNARGPRLFGCARLTTLAQHLAAHRTLPPRCKHVCVPSPVISTCDGYSSLNWCVVRPWPCYSARRRWVIAWPFAIETSRTAPYVLYVLPTDACRKGHNETPESALEKFCSSHTTTFVLYFMLFSRY